jgi:hypothetical protein
MASSTFINFICRYCGSEKSSEELQQRASCKVSILIRIPDDEFSNKYCKKYCRENCVLHTPRTEGHQVAGTDGLSVVVREEEITRSRAVWARAGEWGPSQ